ncbi:autotransporter domain-containing protein [Mesorhizobium sp. B2-3-3]|nr:autotransporter domain-containing protein [Mesorhizobium sp. B2-3-3]
MAFNTGASFTISGVPIARDALAVEAGFDVPLSPNATLGASYSGQIAKDVQGHAFKISFDLKL